MGSIISMHELFHGGQVVHDVKQFYKDDDFPSNPPPVKYHSCRFSFVSDDLYRSLRNTGPKPEK